MLSSYAECPEGAVLTSAGTPIDSSDSDAHAACVLLADGSIIAPAYISVRCVGTPGETNCSDQIDNDGDGLTDCEDLDCSSDVACQPEPPTAIEICDDQIDNDNDSLTDCDDPDCANDVSCQAPVIEICDDQIDNDSDGLIDCDDPDCTNDDACQITTSENPGQDCSDCKGKNCKNNPACAKHNPKK